MAVTRRRAPAKQSGKATKVAQPGKLAGKASPSRAPAQAAPAKSRQQLYEERKLDQDQVNEMFKAIKNYENPSTAGYRGLMSHLDEHFNHGAFKADSPATSKSIHVIQLLLAEHDALPPDEEAPHWVTLRVAFLNNIAGRRRDYKQVSIDRFFMYHPAKKNRRAFYILYDSMHKEEYYLKPAFRQIMEWMYPDVVEADIYLEMNYPQQRDKVSCGQRAVTCANMLWHGDEPYQWTYQGSIGTCEKHVRNIIDKSQKGEPVPDEFWQNDMFGLVADHSRDTKLKMINKKMVKGKLEDVIVAAPVSKGKGTSSKTAATQSNESHKSGSAETAIASQSQKASSQKKAATTKKVPASVSQQPVTASNNQHNFNHDLPNNLNHMLTEPFAAWIEYLDTEQLDRHTAEIYYHGLMSDDAAVVQLTQTYNNLARKECIELMSKSRNTNWEDVAVQTCGQYWKAIAAARVLLPPRGSVHPPHSAERKKVAKIRQRISNFKTLVCDLVREHSGRPKRACAYTSRYRG